jgi:hypothetical protein
MKTCWYCYPDIKWGCVRPSSLLCADHRPVEKARLEALKDQYDPGWRERAAQQQQQASAPPGRGEGE